MSQPSARVVRKEFFADLYRTIYHVVYVGLDMVCEEPTTRIRSRLTEEEGSWRHRFIEEEIELFRPELTYEEFGASR